MLFDVVLFSSAYFVLLCLIIKRFWAVVLLSSLVKQLLGNELFDHTAILCSADKIEVTVLWLSQIELPLQVVRI